jgi:hypothetical protein
MGMSKRKWIWGIFGALGAGTALLSYNITLGSETLAEMDRLLAEGQKEAEACRQFRKKWSEMRFANLNDQSRTHFNKEEALETLRLMESYPLPPSAYRKVVEIYDRELPSWRYRLNQVGFIARGGNAEVECEIFTMMRHGALLLEDAKAFNLGAQDRERIRNVLRAYLKDHAPVASLIGLAVRATMLKSLMEHTTGPNRDKAIGRAQAFLELLEERRVDLENERKAQTGGERTLPLPIFLVSYHAPERNLVRELNKEYSSLLELAQI